MPRPKKTTTSPKAKGAGATKKPAPKAKAPEAKPVKQEQAKPTETKKASSKKKLFKLVNVGGVDLSLMEGRKEIKIPPFSEGEPCELSEEEQERLTDKIKAYPTVSLQEAK